MKKLSLLLNAYFHQSNTDWTKRAKKSNDNDDYDDLNFVDQDFFPRPIFCQKTRRFDTFEQITIYEGVFERGSKEVVDHDGKGGGREGDNMVYRGERSGKESGGNLNSEKNEIEFNIGKGNANGDKSHESVRMIKNNEVFQSMV